MPTPLLQIDAFTDRPYAGNPAAVCLLEAPADPAWMHSVAAEMNLSETAFVHAEDGAFGLRWFTPTVEVDLCGHATLAAAHALRETGRVGDRDAMRFHTRSGSLAAQPGGEGWIRMDFPSDPPVETDSPAGLAAALGLRPRAVWRGRFDYLVELASEEEVEELAPDIRAIGEIGARGIIVTAASEGSTDFVSRFFAPRVGVAEDPVTGSAHCTLAPFWTGRLGRSALIGRQISARGGTVRTEVRGDRVMLSGQAVTILRGELVH